LLLNAKFHYAIWSQTGSKLVADLQLVLDAHCRSATSIEHVCDQIAQWNLGLNQSATRFELYLDMSNVEIARTCLNLVNKGKGSRRSLWSPYVIGQTVADHYIFALCLFLLFFSSPNLSGRRLDVYHTSTHGVAANLECRSEICCTRLAGNTGRKKSPFWHHSTTLSGYIFGTKACIENQKKTC